MSNINVMRKNLGPVTAYKYAVQQGYTGTEQEFAALMASYATVAEEAEAAKDDAVDAKTAAEAAQQAAEAAAEQAEGAIEVDDTLSIGGRAADAKVTGDEITALKAVNSELKSSLNALKSNEKETIQLSKLIYVQNGYIDNNGAFQSPSSASHKIVSMDASKLRYVSFNTSTALGSNMSFAVLKDSANNIVQVLRSSTSGLKEFNITPQSGYVLYIAFYNYATTPNPYYSVIQVINYDDIVESYNLVKYSAQILTESEKTQVRTNINACDKDVEIVIANDVKMIELSSMDYVQNGYIDGSGSFVSPTSASHKIVSIDASKIRYLQFQTAVQYTNSFSFGVIKDSDDNIVQIFKFDNTTNLRTFDITPDEGYTLYVSWFNFATIPNPNYSSFGIKDYESLINAYETEVKGIAQEITDSAVNEVKYHDCVKKPFVFSGKTIWFFGDSITYGYIGASDGIPAHQAINQYPKLFSEAVEAQSYVNWGVSGSTLSDTYTTISTHPLNCDFIFVAGGVNDWQTGVNETLLINTVTNICEHLKNNFSGEVIFITPINEAGRAPITTPAQTLQNVRNVITRIALQYGYSVVQGWTFPFPTKWDTNDYINAIFQDKLHPTELGYSMYAQALMSALC